MKYLLRELARVGNNFSYIRKWGTYSLTVTDGAMESSPLGPVF